MPEDPTGFHHLLRYAMFVVMSVVGSAMMASIPFAIAGRGNRLLWLLVTPCILAALFGLEVLVSRALGHAQLYIFFLPALPAILCVSAWMFRRWRERSAISSG
jgi:hypothetical protein